MPKTKPDKTPEKRRLSSEELNQLKENAYWTDPRKLRVASPDPQLYPRSLWRKVEEECQKRNRRNSKKGWNNDTTIL